MRERAADLLARAAVCYDRSARLAPAARAAIGGGFTSGATWLALALDDVRGTTSPPRTIAANAIGWAKYGASALAALATALAAIRLDALPLTLLAIPVFYAVEAQWVFAFPLALDGAAHPLRAARRLTRRAGGTVAVMRVVMPLAFAMLFGGFAGRGFLRSWCLGCMAIVLWYEATRAGAP